MAIVSNTFLTYSAKGIREDLSNVITNIAPEETPYSSNIGRENVSNSLYEWQTDTLASAAANAQLEGDDVASFDSVTATVRMQNYAQISRKTIILSATEEVVNKAGRRSELAYQIAKRGAELKRDQEYVMLNGGVAVAGDCLFCWPCLCSILRIPSAFCDFVVSTFKYFLASRGRMGEPFMLM